MWIFQYFYELTLSEKSCIKKMNLNNTSNVRVRRLLYGKTYADSQHIDFLLKDKFQDNYLNSYDSLNIRDHFENSTDSLMSDNYLHTSHEELEREPSGIKKYEFRKKTGYSSRGNYLKKLNAKYDSEIVKLLDSLFKTSNEYKNIRKLKFKNILKVCSPVIISSLLIASMMLLSQYSSFSKFLAIPLFIFTVIFVTYKLAKNMKMRHLRK
ncbi:hypothetical protein PMALA_074070 [Plasmodium malariae]|uniref:Pv-fam-d protein n=1 Tax=Plasmodium malariae TaxID=5858 RepID=A0A1A8X782_PLAMA|nr:hypothetical protein PMALA_074070 [Plasmodium malariae]